MTQDQEILTEFIIETNENLTRLSQDLVAIETRPKDAELLASIFRTFHTIKGTSGFLGFSKLESRRSRSSCETVASCYLSSLC